MELSERSKTILKLVAFLGVTFVIGFALYTLFFSSSPSVSGPGNTTSDNTNQGSLPNAGDSNGTPTTSQPGTDDEPGRLEPSPVADGGLTFTTQITNTAVSSPTIMTDGNIAYYDPADGRFYSINEKGTVEALSLAQFPEAENVVFDAGATEAVIEFPDGSNIVYNFETAEQVTLPEHWSEFSFSADGTDIASKSLGNDVSSRALVITSADGSSTEVVASLGDNADKIDVDWSPAGDIVGFSETGGGASAFGQNKIYTIGTDGEASGIFTVNGSNFLSEWSPSGKYLLYSVADASDDYRASLWYVDARGDRKGDTRVRLSVKTTANKCAFASETVVYCAVPNTMPTGGGTSASLITSPDTLYKITVPSGKASVAAIPAADTQMFNLSLSADGDILYFTDESGKLNVIRLQ